MGILVGLSQPLVYRADRDADFSNPAELCGGAGRREKDTMQDLLDLIHPNAIVYRIKAQTKNEVLLAMAEAAVKAYGVELSATLESTLERERLGSTGVGEGVAIPHARLKGLDTPKAVLAILDPAIDFEAPDGRAADVVVLLLSPDEAGADHLKALARLSRLLRRQDVRDGLRSARSAAAIYAFTSQGFSTEAA
ncbi:PTS sugar transporter subunit IIA [Candidatus Phycosocius spiralis]|uniref:PTS IIA-like nitrogen-regulatory protein PtsN n=1 Tax=Candidatus Phycosocius spiralis TaxID=2815099 RepID=A0ABQ4PTW8_9PROT|nr:PTS sugar transporter subunit IIA [Candidatus Phycosocius spiralis]GIU66443.1 PTS IIA-like nitrogen-regulatory protein PtsN [Candidatus Phycosocius spiralis]